MNSSLKRGLFLVSVIGTVSVSGETVEAADGMEETDKIEAAFPSVGIEQVLNDCYTADESIAVEEYLVPTKKGEYLDMAFTDVGADTFLFVRSEPTRESEWVGKLYPGSASEIIGPVGEWTKVQSGTVTGYVYTEYIITGNEAEAKARELAADTEAEDIREVVEHAESREEEEARLAEEARIAAEEAARIAEEQAANAATQGQAVVDYACQFIGNPYVPGGTSLTQGADCSGFVWRVYQDFGYSVPRTSYSLRSSGSGVSYSEAQPGDVICYAGHVGIYIGNGQIVHASTQRSGIKITNATYKEILSVRRIV